MTLGEKLKQARLERGLTQAQVCGDRITRNMLSQLENDLASPSVRTLEHLSSVLCVSMGWLLEENPAAERLQQARLLYAEGDYRHCFHLLCDVGAGEEGRLLLIRSALRISEEALADGHFREAQEAASAAVEQCTGSLYAGLHERIRANRILLRCAVEQGTDAEALVRALQSDCAAMGLEPSIHLLVSRYHLSRNDPEAAAQELQRIAETTAEDDGEYLLLQGRVEMASRRWQEAEAVLHQAEASSRLTRIRRKEIYKLLEACCREREDYRQAYFYATRQLQLEENGD